MWQLIYHSQFRWEMVGADRIRIGDILGWSMINIVSMIWPGYITSYLVLLSYSLSNFSSVYLFLDWRKKISRKTVIYFFSSRIVGYQNFLLFYTSVLKMKSHKHAPANPPGKIPQNPLVVLCGFSSGLSANPCQHTSQPNILSKCQGLNKIPMQDAESSLITSLLP